MMNFRRWSLAGLVSAAVWGLLARSLTAEDKAASVFTWPSRVIQLPTEENSHKPPVVTAIRLHGDGQRLVTAGDDHIVRVWSLETGKLLQRLDSHIDWVRTVDYSPDGSVLASSGNDRQIIFWEATRGVNRNVFAVQKAAIASIRFSHDGKIIAAVGFDKFVRLYDVNTKRLIVQVVAPCQDVRAVAFSPDDQLLAIGGRCGTVRLLTVPGGALQHDIPAHRLRVRSIAFSSDGSFIASVGDNGVIHIAPVAGATNYRLPPRPGKIMSLAFYGPQRLAVAGSDNLIRLWDVATQKEVGLLPGHTGSIACLECQGKILVSAGYDTTVRIWNVGD